LRVGILGGAFNPPHVGHLVCAQEAAMRLELEQLQLMPFRDPPHRTLEVEPGPDIRYAMCEAAVRGDPILCASRMELDRPGPSYTVDTLRLWRDVAPDDEVFLVMGADQAATLADWREPEKILQLATVAVVERELSTRQRVFSETHSLAGSERILFFDMPRIEVSSTMVRRRVREGLPIRYLVPGAVRRVIEKQELYGASRVASR
jgi:nicotinate-nucleotide adenylyltransferase